MSEVIREVSSWRILKNSAGQARLSMDALVKLRGCEMHSTHLMEPGDENPLKQLGLEITTDARLYLVNNND